MEPRRIILAHVPRLLREMLERALTAVPGLRIIEELSDLAQVPEALERTGAEWVIVSLPPGGKLSSVTEPLLVAHPSVRLVNMVSDGSHVTMQWVEPREQALDEFSMNELIALLRDEPNIPANQSPLIEP